MYLIKIFNYHIECNYLTLEVIILLEGWHQAFLKYRNLIHHDLI